MATIRSRGRNGVFHALWYVRASTSESAGSKRKGRLKLVQKSTGTSNRKKAQEIADKWELESRRPESEVVMEQMRKVMAEIYRRIKGRDESTEMNVAEFCKRWLRGKKAELKPASLAFYRTATEKLCEFLERRGRGGAQIYEITKSDITDFRDSLAETLSASSANHYLKAARMIFKAARIDGWIPESPAEQVKTLRVRVGDKQKALPFAVEQVNWLLKFADAEWQSMIRIAFYTGKRLHDVATLKESQVDLMDKVIRWRISKTDSNQISPMPPALVEAMLRRDWSDGADRPMHPRAAAMIAGANAESRTSPLSRKFAELLIEAGFRKAKAAPATDHALASAATKSRRRTREMFSFHSLRHTLATNLASLKVDKRVAMEIVGHDNEDIHEGYTHLPLELLREAIERLPALDIGDEGEKK